MGGGMMGAYIIGAIFMGISSLVGRKLQSKFKEYSQMGTSSGLSGKEVAEKMLADNGITDVQVISTAGQLTDHYNPAKKTVNLSEVVYNERNVAAAAVAAHEVGHAIQHATAYRWLGMRSKLVPAVNLSSKMMKWVLLAGIMVVGTFPQLLFAGIVLFSVTTLFSLITLPVEFDASKRALAWLNGARITSPQEHVAAKDALKWAAMTYFVAFLASFGTLLYYVMIYLNRR